MRELHRRLDGFHGASGLSAALVMAMTLSLAACGGGTGFQQTWSEPTSVGVLLDRVGVVGVAADPAVRTQFEDAFTRTLKLRGNDARAGHSFIPEEMRGRLDQIKQKLVDERFDGVLVTRLAPAAPDSAGAGELAGNLETPTAAAGASTRVQLRTSLYRVADGKLLWEAVTASSRGGSIQKDAAAFSETVARELHVQGMLR